MTLYLLYNFSWSGGCHLRFYFNFFFGGGDNTLLGVLLGVIGVKHSFMALYFVLGKNKQLNNCF